MGTSARQNRTVRSARRALQRPAILAGLPGALLVACLAILSSAGAQETRAGEDGNIAAANATEGVTVAAADSNLAAGDSSVATADSAEAAVVSEQTPLVQALEGGIGYSEFTKGYGNAHYQFARFSVERPYDWRWQFEVGTQSRFDDTSLDFGVSFTKFLWGETHLTLAASSGTGDYIAPEYRLDVSLAQPIVGMLLRLGYTREQSKAENRRDGLGVGLERWFPHWILAAHWRYDMGYPGDTVSRTAGFGVTYYTWEKLYVGAGVEWGDISYMQVGPSSFLVDYESEEYRLGIAYWFTSHAGVNFSVNYGETPFYEVTGVELSFFGRW